MTRPLYLPLADGSGVAALPPTGPEAHVVILALDDARRVLSGLERAGRNPLTRPLCRKRAAELAAAIAEAEGATTPSRSLIG